MQLRERAFIIRLINERVDKRHDLTICDRRIVIDEKFYHLSVHLRSDWNPIGRIARSHLARRLDRAHHVRFHYRRESERGRFIGRADLHGIGAAG